MIRVRTPLRLPFAGGLTDIKRYAAEFGGVTVSSTMDLGVEVTVEPSGADGFRITTGDVVETVETAASIGNDLVRTALAQVGYEGPGLALTIDVEVQDHSGLGTSGAITVALVHALRLLLAEEPDAALLAADATRIEVEMLGGASGYHDANVCARGGLLRLDYAGSDVTAHQLSAPEGFRRGFQDSLLLFATGRRASTKASLSLLSAGYVQAVPVLHDMKELALEAARAYEAGDLTRLAATIGEQQRLKQLLPGTFVDEFVERLGEKVRATGAHAQFPGGKIGGYVMVCCPEAQQTAVRSALAEFAEVPVRLSDGGSHRI